METADIQRALSSLDSTASGLVDQINSISRQVNNYIDQAENYMAEASYYMSMASSEEDPERAQSLYASADACVARAGACREEAAALKEQIGGLKGQLGSLVPQYEYYRSEGMNKIAELSVTVDKLMGVSGSKYGGAQIKGVLVQAKERLVFNQRLVSGCNERINWINNICGSSGDANVKTLTKHR